jgi:hypothetical protein
MEPPSPTPEDDFRPPAPSGHYLNIPPGLREAFNIPWEEDPPPSTNASGVQWNSGLSITKVIVESEYRYATIGLIVGSLVALAGVLMILLNISGAIDLTIRVGDNEVKINTAVVGIVVTIVGAAISFFTRARLSFADKQNRQKRSCWKQFARTKRPKQH